MPIIQFDVLVPDAQVERVEEIFQTAGNKLVAAGKLTAATVTRDDTPRIGEGVEETLRETYREEHEGFDLEDSSVRRYAIAVDGVTGSVNELAMVLSRLLTPHAALSRDRVVLEQEKNFEQPAIFPWTVEILR